MKLPRSLQSLRGQLLAGILIPVVIFILVDAVGVYRQALAAVTTAYDRTLLASAKAISETLDVEGTGDRAILRANVSYGALEAFEADNRSRFAYRISNLQGQLVDGFSDLPVWRGQVPTRGPYAALVDFYDDRFRDQPVRVAVLLQPVASAHGLGMAVIQVAETLELRQTLARQVLVDTIWRQGVLMLVVAAVVVVVVQVATRPVRALGKELDERASDDFSPLQTRTAMPEMRPLVDAVNTQMTRLAQVLEHQKRFVRDASHQLRTPLAVLKTQVQSARAGDVDAQQALSEIAETVERATRLATQMLALAKVEQLRQDGARQSADWADIVRDVALDLAPLIAEKDLDFELQSAPAVILAHEWMLRELTRNLLHNAIRHSPRHGVLSVRLDVGNRLAHLQITDTGSGVPPEMADRLFRPFSAADTRAGSGLGLAICREIVAELGGRISLTSRSDGQRALGASADVWLPTKEGPSA